MKLLFVLAAVCAAMAGKPRSIPVIIAGEGEFAFTDGSSVYRFSRDGGFRMEPLTLSGRAIEGTWTPGNQGQFVVTGVWTWYNGLSVPDDFRRMTMTVAVLPGGPETVQTPWGGSGTRLYPVSFTIDEVAPVDSLPGR